MRKIIFTLFAGLTIWIVAAVFLTGLPESDSWWTLDTFFHFVGGVFAAWCGSLFSRDKINIFLVALMIGLLWELAEYISSVYGQDYWPVIYNYYRGGGLVDSVHDLIADVLGAGLFILLYYRYEK